MSNPKPVEGALRDLADELNQCLQIIVTNAGNIKVCVDGAERRAARQIEKAVERASKATRKMAALSAVPAPESRESILADLEAVRQTYWPGQIPLSVIADIIVNKLADAPARDGVRRLEAAMDMRMAVRQAFDVIAKANTVTGLSLAEMEQVVIKELQAAAAKEQADGQ